MLNKILFVDDEPNVLSSISRQLRGKFDLLTADSGRKAVDMIQKQDEIAVIVSDYKMPEMNGVEFLMKAKELTPDSVRLMLTGQADFDAVIDVINEGNIFRFLTKPCPSDLLQKNINDGVRQYKLLKAEKELLSKTLSGSIKLITELMTYARPGAFSKSRRVHGLLRKLMKEIEIDESWQVEIAAMLSQIGCIKIPNDVLERIYKNLPVPSDYMEIYSTHSSESSGLLSKIPRLEQVAHIIKYQDKNYDGSGHPADSVSGEDIPPGSRILKVLLDYDRLREMKYDQGKALKEIKNNIHSKYDEKIVTMLYPVLSDVSI